MARRPSLTTILVITRNYSIRSRVKSLLDPAFFVIESKTWLSALSAARYATLHLILIDDQVEDGLSICQKLRELPSQSQTPICLLTGRLSKAYRWKARKAGVTEFLSPLFEASDLLRVVTAAYSPVAAAASPLFETVTATKPPARMKWRAAPARRDAAVENASKSIRTKRKSLENG